MNTEDWRTQLPSDARQRVLNKIRDKFTRYFSVSGEEGLNNVRKLAVSFEERIFTAATSQSDYLRRISLKLLTMENNSQKYTIPLQSNQSQALLLPMSRQSMMPQHQPPQLQHQQPQMMGQVSISLLGSQNLTDQQKQLYQSQRAVPDTSSNSIAQTGLANGGDWQEEVYQKIQTLKEKYLPELNEIYQKIATKLAEHDSNPQQLKSGVLDKMKLFKTMLERVIGFLSVSKANITPISKEKLSSYEKQMVKFINSSRTRKPVSMLHQDPPHTHSMQQPQPQINQTQSHDGQMNPQLQPKLNSLQTASNLDSVQSNALGSIQPVAPEPLQQNTNLMDTNSWRSTLPGGEPTMDTVDWRTQLQPDSRQRIVNMIMDGLKRHQLPLSDQEDLIEINFELWKTAVMLEEKIFMEAASQSDYLRRIFLKMLKTENKSQNIVPNMGSNSKPPDPGPLSAEIALSNPSPMGGVSKALPILETSPVEATGAVSEVASCQTRGTIKGSSYPSLKKRKLDISSLNNIGASSSSSSQLPIDMAEARAEDKAVERQVKLSKKAIENVQEESDRMWVEKCSALEERLKVLEKKLEEEKKEKDILKSELNLAKEREELLQTRARDVQRS